MGPSFLLACVCACLLIVRGQQAEITLPKDMKPDSASRVNVLWDHGLGVEEIAREQQEVQQLSLSWQAALNSRNASAVTALYDSSALLYATFKTRLTSPSEILAYFAALCSKPDLNVEFESEDIRIFARNVAINSGIYVFSFTAESGLTVNTPARFTFVFMRESTGPSADQWLIIDHHSSQDPEKTHAQEVRKSQLVKQLAELYSEL